MKIIVFHISVKFITNDKKNNRSALAKVMAWRWADD